MTCVSTWTIGFCIGWTIISLPVVMWVWFVRPIFESILTMLDS